MDFHHLGIASRNVYRDAEHYCALGYSVEKFVEDPNLGVRLLFLTSECMPRVELVEDLYEDRPVVKDILACGIRVYHWAFCCSESLQEILAKLQCASSVRGGGRVIVQPTPAVAFDGVLVSFFMPRDGMMLEIIEKK